MIGITVKNFDKLTAKLEEICRRLPKTAEQAVKTSAEKTQKIAVRLARGRALKNCIKAEIIDTDTNEVITYRIFNDTDELYWSSYVEFGTGLYVDNEGVDESIRLKRAKQIPWYVHVDMVDADFARFGYPRQGNYWVVDGMRPHPYLKPAGFERRSANTENIISAIKGMIQEVCT